MLAKVTKPLRHKIVKGLCPTLWKQQMTEDVDSCPRPFTRMLSRLDLKGLIGAEIGFGTGDNAISLLNELDIKHLICVDGHINEEYIEGNNLIMRYIGEAKEVKDMLLKDNRVSFIEVDTPKAFDFMPTELDFVYIDGNHSYDFVMSDLIHCWNLVKTGGFIAGHDFVCRPSGTFEVVPAVFNFAMRIKQQPRFISPDFWFVRTE